MECFHRSRLAETTDMNLLIRRTRGEGDVRLPIDVQSRCTMIGELLLTDARIRIPDNRRSIDTGR